MTREQAIDEALRRHRHWWSWCEDGKLCVPPEHIVSGIMPAIRAEFARIQTGLRCIYRSEDCPVC